MANDILQKYYGSSGEYLEDHKDFLQQADLKKDLHFLIEALHLTKNDSILDIACGQGRHTNAFSQLGYRVDGVDISEYLLSIAREEAKLVKGRSPEYYHSDVMDIKLQGTYSKAFWFFSDLAEIDVAAAITSISKCLKKGGSVLFDVDNIFRIISYLQRTPDSDFSFDACQFVLWDHAKNLSVPYPPFLLWQKWLSENGLTVSNVYGDYDFGEYSITSPRLIIVAEKLS